MCVLGIVGGGGGENDDDDRMRRRRASVASLDEWGTAAAGAVRGDAAQRLVAAVCHEGRCATSCGGTAAADTGTALSSNTGNDPESDGDGDGDDDGDDCDCDGDAARGVGMTRGADSSALSTMALSSLL